MPFSQLINAYLLQPKHTAVLSYSFSDMKGTVSYILKTSASLTEWNNRLTHLLSYRDPHFGYYGLWRLLLGYPATSGAKSDNIFLLGDPDFLYRRRNFAPILLSARDLMQDRQTDRWQTDATTIW